jgi:hypothetical protein
MSMLNPASGMGALFMEKQDPGYYNKQLEEFYAAHEKYVVQLNEFEERKQATIILEIELANTGSAPAKDIHILMHFPDGLEVYEEDGFESSMVEPTEPKVPLVSALYGIRAMASWPSAPLFVPPRIPSIQSIHSNVTGWSVKRSDSYEVRGHVKELTHGLRVRIGSLFVVFESRETVNSFAIDYQLLTASPPQQLSGKLHVIVES